MAIAVIAAEAGGVRKLKLAFGLKEVIAGIGLAFSWLVPLAILTAQMTTCTQLNTGSFFGSVIFSGLLSLFSVTLLLIGAGGRRGLLWLAAPHLILLPWAIVFIAPYFWFSTLGGHHLCSVFMGGTGTRPFYGHGGNWAWAPAELLLLGANIFAGIRYWRKTPRVRGQ